MGVESTVVYVCDKCGLQERSPGHESRCTWYEVKADMGMRDEPHLLCITCHRRLVSWLNEAPEVIGADDMHREGVYR